LRFFSIAHERYLLAVAKGRLLSRKSISTWHRRRLDRCLSS
jgi:hypothetical protein